MYCCGPWQCIGAFCMLSARSRRESLSCPFPKDCKESDSQAIIKERIFLLSLNRFTTYTLHKMHQYCQFNITLWSFFSFHAGDKQPPLKKVQSTRKRFRFYVYSPEHDRECETVKVISSHLLVAGLIVTKQRIDTNITSLTRTPF